MSQLNGELIFEMNVRKNVLNFVYKSTRGLLTVTFPETIPSETWTYIALQVQSQNLHGVLMYWYVNVLQWNFDQTLVNSLHRLLNFEIGGLDCRVIISEYISHVFE